MNWMYMVYFLLGALLCFGAKLCPRGVWNEEYTSRQQTKVLTGVMTLGVALHHMAQKTCAPWHPSSYTVHGLDFFVGIGFPVVAVFFFCSGLGLYRSLHSKPDYLKGFLRRRVLRIVIAFYLSEWIYTAVRLLMGQKMDLIRILWYLSGLHMANTYSWYVIVIPFFYLVFWAAFRFCKREGIALFWVFAFTLAYTVIGTLIDHQDDWWMRGEWWYNSIILFPLGLLFGRFEKQVTRFFRKGYWIWLLIFFAGTVLLFMQSEYLVNNVWGYYGEGMKTKIPHRLLSAGSQWLVCIVFTGFCFLLMMKVKPGNKALAWLGAMSLEFYLMHGLFVELFGFGFLDVTKSLTYIRNVPLYMLAVLACSVPAALLFRLLWRLVADLLTGERKKRRVQVAAETEAEAAAGVHVPHIKIKFSETPAGQVIGRIRKWIWPLMFVLMVLAYFLLSPKDGTRVVGGMIVTPPEGFEQSSSSARYVTWEYTKNDKSPGKLILDEEIKGNYAQRFASADEVLRECDWMTDAELYINPQGIRMARGFSAGGSGYPERRYYVETNGAVFLLCMIEDSRYYDPADCEEAIQQTADGIRRK